MLTINVIIIDIQVNDIMMDFKQILRLLKYYIMLIDIKRILTLIRYVIYTTFILVPNYF